MRRPLKWGPHIPYVATADPGWAGDPITIRAVVRPNVVIISRGGASSFAVASRFVVAVALQSALGPAYR